MNLAWFHTANPKCDISTARVFEEKTLMASSDKPIFLDYVLVQ